MRKISFLFFCSLICLQLHAQNYWGNSFGGNQNDETFGVEIDYPSGNASISVGYFTGTSNFHGTNISSVGLSDIFITKHASDGTLLWTKQIGGSGEERAVSVSLDGTGNIYITGHFWGSFEFDGTTYTSYGQEDAFIAKLDQNGNPLWFTQEGGSSSDLSFSIEVDVFGNPVITGEFNGTSTFGSTILTADQEDVFIAKYNGSSGALMWVQQGTADFSDRGIAICTDENANIYVTGQFSDTITFDNTHNYNLYNGIYVIKFDPSGNEQWFRVIAGGLTNIAYDISSDNAGNIYLTGDFTGGLQFLPPINQSLSNPHYYKVFIAKMTTAGGLVWAKADGSDNEITSRAIDVRGSQVGIAGMFKCTFDEYSDLYGVGTFNSVGYWDCFTTSYTTGGTRTWARQWASARNDKATGIVIDNSGIFLLSGSANKNLNVPNPTVYNPNWYPAASGSGSPNYGYCSNPDYSFYQRLGWGGKADAFVGKLIDPLRETYDYYYRESPGCAKPYVPGCINSSATLIPFSGSCTPDTIEFCGHGWLYANTHTYPDTSGGSGPNFHYTWNPVHSDSAHNHITTSGEYNITMTTFDGCYSSSDEVYAIVHPLPPKPLITDNAVVNDHDLITQIIEGCEPDSFLLTGTPIGSLSNYTSYQWGITPGMDSTEWVNSTGYYYFYVTDSIGCSRHNVVYVDIHSVFQTIVPEIICLDDTDNNDSIDVCQNQYVNMQVIDTLTYSGSIPDLNCGCSVTAPGYSTSTSFVNNSSGYPYSIFGFVPTVDDQLYILSCHLTQINICDTVEYDVYDSIFINLNPNPVAMVDVTGPATFCSGDSVIITATGNGPIEWTYSHSMEVYFNNDTLVIDQPGNIYVEVLITDSNGCSAYDYDVLTVLNPNPPTAYTNPTNGLICPDDSVQLNVWPTTYTSYTWVGPGLLPFPNSASVYTSVPGLYYCTVIDANGCELVSNIIEVFEYSTPGIYVVPNNFLCYIGDTATIHVTTNLGSLIHWVNPSSGGSSPSVLVDQPGIYTCEILSCGILTTSNVTIEVDTHTVNIYATGDLEFCENSDFVINATPGYPSYVWQPGSMMGQSITITTGGRYWVNVIDEYGCEIHSDTINLISYPTTAEDPDTMSAFFCVPDFVTLYATGSGVVTWYDSPTSTTPINTGGSYTTPILNGTTTYYVENANDSCTSNRIPVYAIAVPCDTLYIPNVFTPNDDGLNDIITFHLFGATCFHLIIYDRWGTEVFATDNMEEGWRGTNLSNDPLVDGVYYYVIEYCPAHKPPQVKKGFIHLFN